MTHKPEQTNKTTPMAASVLERIASEHVVPSSRSWFVTLEIAIWVLWALTVTVGAIAIAVVEHVGVYALFALREATHANAFSYYVDILPHIWLILFVIMAGLAYVNVRHTRRGYRYQLHYVLLSSIILSLVGGTLLHMVGVGSAIDTQFGKQMPMYQSMQKIETTLWQRPSEGRLIGTFVGMDETDTQYLFLDTDNTQWVIETTELPVSAASLLMTGKEVRMLGVVTNEETKQFYACGVFPWMMQKDMPIGERRAGREQFLEGMREHKKRNMEITRLEREVYGADTPMPFTGGKCGELAAVKRMRF